MDFPQFQQLKGLLELARHEDLGDADLTSEVMVDENEIGVGTLLQKEVGIACGLPLVPMICATFDERLKVEQIPGFHLELIEGRFSDARQTPLLRLRGPMRSLLAVERTLLNFLQHLSGIATLTQRFARRCEGTRAKIYDTRKTTPGLRLLEKYAVTRGGGHNHRTGLFDAVLIKDNHLAGIALSDLASRLQAAVTKARQTPAKFFEVEVTSLEQLREALKVEGINIVLLDNMDCPRMSQAVEIRNKLRPGVELEASGGITLETVREVAQTGVDRISVGAITHSATALDISLEIEKQ